MPGRSKTASKPGNRISYRTVITTSGFSFVETQQKIYYTSSQNPKLKSMCPCVCVCVFFFSFLPLWKGWQFFLLVRPFQTISGIGKFLQAKFFFKTTYDSEYRFDFSCTCCSVTDNYILDSIFYFLILFYTLHDIVKPEAENPYLYVTCLQQKQGSTFPLSFLSLDVVEKQTI